MPASGQATPVENLTLLPGFKAELLYSVPRDQGSWVSMTFDPKGRIINHRPPNALDLERTFEVALETGVALETNGLPDRLDLSGPEIRLAIEAGVPIVVSTDAHSVRGLGNMRLAVHTARRGWATAADVVNTRPLEEVLVRRR